MLIKDIIKDAKNAQKALDFSQKSVTIFGSARFDETNLYCKMAYDLAYKLSNLSYAVITGGGNGIMSAANKGAFDADKSPSIGLNVVLPHEQGINKFTTGGTIFSGLASRKVALTHKSDLFVVFPGGFGTLDELFEVLVLIQVGFKDAKVYLYGKEFWNPLVEFFKVSLITHSAISPLDMELFLVSDDVDEIINDIHKNR